MFVRQQNRPLEEALQGGAPCRARIESAKRASWRANRSALTRFTEDGRIALENSAVERFIRPITLWKMRGSQASTKKPSTGPSSPL
ncbi:hypothetical protein E4K64_09605 [Bradyrhizobium frederickii]|uniref:Transposase IS66 central domain-containing protein n=1 Tax=Bradyrhizobium frederickii TaxID=2560054 RepID=A0A4Y9PEK5_9BRAD|nr:hypothetical protein E4K64_09605 [Bradyrhizobium frederickii]